MNPPTSLKLKSLSSRGVNKKEWINKYEYINFTCKILKDIIGAIHTIILILSLAWCWHNIIIIILIDAVINFNTVHVKFTKYSFVLKPLEDGDLSLKYVEGLKFKYNV